MRLAGGIGILLLASASFARAEAPAAAGPAVDYLRDIKPLLAERCYSCHGGLKQESGLRLDTGMLIRQGGDSGAAIAADKAEESLLIERVSAVDPAVRMPPEGSALSAEQVALLKAWIAAGAPSPDDEKPEASPRDHWAFQPVARPALPALLPGEEALCANPIDRFIVTEYAERGLSPAPRAASATLLRRLTLDLIGIPPTPEELHEFLAACAKLGEEAAYERLVDRLLASPKYGERWGRHWMDVWRYSDWYGRRAVPDVMISYPQIWRWRDWIVKSLNGDRGYDWMVKQMLAADEITPTDDENIVATGFLVRNWFKWNYEQWMKDNVEHTGKAFLGLTLNCCHCHDHKYDPITQEEYFRFRAFFEPLELRQDRVPGLPDPGPFEKYIYTKAYGPIAHGMIRVFDEKLEAQTFMYSKGDSRNRLPDRPPVSPGAPAILGGDKLAIAPVDLPVETYYPGEKSFIREEETAKAALAIDAAEQAEQAAKLKLADAERSLADVRAQSQLPVTAAAVPPAEALVNAQQAVLDARLTLQTETARVAAARAGSRAVQSRLAADDARYRGVGEAAQATKAAALAEKQAAYEAALANVAACEQAVVVAERNAARDASTAPAAQAAKDQLAAARTAADAARSALVAPGETYQPFSPVYPQKSTGRRKALAEWIVSRENPLPARVAANHIWLRHFGRALVPTTSNFGRQGKSPSHPALLDWLATRLIESGWSMKELHREIVTSNTYKLASSVDRDQTSDSENAWYWRANPRRMEAEVVRDSVLAVAGSLDEMIGGQEIDHAQGLTNRRRSLYFAIHGESQMEFLSLFDGPSVVDCYERSTSVMPQQSLAMVNSELAQQQSLLLAESFNTVPTATTASESERSSIAEAWIIAAFERILTRAPTNAELTAASNFLNKQQKLFEASPDAQRTPESRARQSLLRALYSHNDFVTIR